MFFGSGGFWLRGLSLSDSLYKEKSIRIYPFAFYSKETSVSVGLAGLFFIKPSDTVNTSYIQLTAVYSLKNQVNLEFWYQFFLQGDVYKITGFTDYNRFPLLFFGVGEMPGNPEHFTPAYSRFRISVLRKISPHVRIGPRYWFETTTLKEIQPNGFFDMYPSHHRVSAPGAVIQHDSRDNIFYPLKGNFLEFSVLHSSPVLGSTSSITNLLIDFRHFHKLSDRIISCTQLYINHLEGNPSSVQMSLTGGPRILRGYYLGMFRAKHVSVLQQEFRYKINNRFKTVWFGSLGSARNNFKSAPQVLLASGGVGLRIALDLKKQIHLRTDFAITRHGNKGLYLMLEEAF